MCVQLTSWVQEGFIMKRWNFEQERCSGIFIDNFIDIFANNYDWLVRDIRS